MEVLENLAYLANASNLVLYLSNFMNFSPSTSANAVTSFMGTAFLLALLGGFLSDSYFTTYSIYLISAITELVVRFLHTFTTKLHAIFKTLNFVNFVSSVTSSTKTESSSKAEALYHK